ncbi:MAG TPA: UDP-N-acetylmuramate dehydrogenase [Spirochaetota bacterium]|nr:UDP-N-acetylmuramate dehydrogenase [Spirochaetota bacterium]HPP93942.1 UDP-N-acetylmuramate dehydrogenase [Spirochaetota bacterium]
MSNNFYEMPADLQKELQSHGRLFKNFSLKDVTTFKTGGTADYLFEPLDEDSLIKAFAVLKEVNCPYHIIGGGSNLLVSDKGLSGIVIRLYSDSEPVRFDEGFIYASANVSKERFIQETIDHGYGGVEFMAGIPGAIGGGIFMNAGTFMGSFSDILKSIKLLTQEGDIIEREITSSLCSYRDMNIPKGAVILGGYFSLPKISSHEIETLKKEIEKIIQERWKKHPMEYPSAGSVFKNPEGFSSWKLIDDCGLKGFSIGGAKVSEKHTNFIINTGNATSEDIYRLIKKIQQCVMEKHSIALETEVKFMGDFSSDV